MSTFGIHGVFCFIRILCSKILLFCNRLIICELICIVLAMETLNDGLKYVQYSFVCIAGE